MRVRSAAAAVNTPEMVKIQKLPISWLPGGQHIVDELGRTAHVGADQRDDGYRLKRPG